eukprot:scaffold57610_cov34-Tisochrysis_lutea.AAC.3
MQPMDLDSVNCVSCERGISRGGLVVECLRCSASRHCASYAPLAYVVLKWTHVVEVAATGDVGSSGWQAGCVASRYGTAKM